ncbi:MAG: hypothetical protein NUW01_03745 [Gemmatimonadaceae bacterium]|nr:hypothetical protein [Gemmatimonadaceae bacterium]
MTTILTEPARLGNTVLIGQVAVLDIDSMQIQAPSKAKPWFKVNINAALPSDGAPSATDISWLFKPGVTFFVVAEFPEGTFDVASLPNEG